MTKVFQLDIWATKVTDEKSNPLDGRYDFYSCI